MSNVIYTYATPEGAPKGTRERRVLDSRPKVDIDLEPSGHGVASGDRLESDPSCEAVDSCTSPLLGACAGLHQIRRLMCEVDRLRAVETDAMARIRAVEARRDHDGARKSRDAADTRTSGPDRAGTRCWAGRNDSLDRPPHRRRRTSRASVSRVRDGVRLVG